MTGRYRVHWTPEAEQDASAIVDWFQDVINAEKVITQLGERAEGLATFPERGRIVPELQKIGVLQYREIHHRPWRMLYTIRDRDIWIMAVLDGRRQLESLLFERLARVPVL